MTKSVDVIIRERADRLLRQFHKDPAPPKMALGGPDIRATMERHWGPGRWQALPGFQQSDVLMWLSAADPHESSVWAYPAFTNYRDAFIAFLSAAYGLTDPKLPPLTDVDHLQAKSTVNPSGMIRLEAVASSPNRSHGASPEKNMANSPVTAGRKERDHTPGSMTWFVALKLAGLLAPRISTSPSATARRQAAIDYFVAHGWSRPEVEAGINGLFEVQQRR